MKTYGICQHCGAVQDLLHGLCDDCYQEERETINAIRKFLKNHPRSNAMDIAMQTGISISKVTRLIKEGTLI